jgi:small-conductance mechanosensitive channel
MMKKTDILATGSALAVTVALLYILCALAVALWPDGTIEFLNSWVHGVDLKAMKATTPMTFGKFLYGLVTIALVAFAVGVVYAWCYNFVHDRRRATE